VNAKVFSAVAAVLVLGVVSPVLGSENGKKIGEKGIGALRAYAAMVTNASKGAVRDVSQIER